MNARLSSAPSLLAASAIALFPPAALSMGTAAGSAAPAARPVAERRSQASPADAAPPSSPVAASVIFRAEGVLEAGDPMVFQDGSLYDEYIYQGRAGQQITILLESQDFTPYLIVINHTGDILAQSENITPQHTDTVIALTLPADGPYSVIVNGLTRYSRGHYTLTVSGRSPAPNPDHSPASSDETQPGQLPPPP
ncbi:MAG: hypothetical protein VKK04_11380 [Synechococcales bacterium]|nr:hypothetical protein [Synechococcales bacterium]